MTQQTATQMTRYQLLNAAMKIDGYYNPPKDAQKVDEAFLKAKTAALDNLRIAMSNVEDLTVDQFLASR